MCRNAERDIDDIVRVDAPSAPHILDVTLRNLLTKSMLPFCDPFAGLRI